jgi:hypothetical protein
MSTSAHRDSPQIPWLFLGGVLTLLIGFGLSFFGGFFFNGGHEKVVPHNRLPYVALVGLGIAVFALGSHILARIEQLRGSEFSLVTVAFITAPLPAIAGLLFNFLGNYLRRTGSTTVQVILIAAGFFLLALAGTWAWDLHRSNVIRFNFQAFVWPIIADFGIACLLLATLSTSVQRQSTTNGPDQTRE